MKTERNPGDSAREGTRTMRDKSTVFYLGNGKIPCYKFCRIIRWRKNDSIYHFHSMRCVSIKTLFKMYCRSLSVS